MDKLYSQVLSLARQLQDKQLKVATAESCTGGLIAGLLTEFPGSSLWFERGFVTYSNLAKEDMLSVDASLIQTYGAVSQQVAEAMALGALRHSAAQLSLAVTGVAGPGGGSLEKPVGTVWFAWARKPDFVQSLHCYFPDASRQQVRHLSCIQAVEGLISLLNQTAA